MKKSVLASVLLLSTILALGAESIRSSAQADFRVTSAWIPLNVGVRWTYDEESKSGDRQHPTVQRWRSEESISNQISVPEGIVIVRKAVTDKRPNAGYIAAWSASSFLTHNDCLYFLADRTDWDASHQQLGAQFREDLNGGARQPDVCFPIDVGRRWGGLDTLWRVVDVGRSEFVDPKFSQSFHISGRIGSGGATDVWFAKGIGIVAMRYLHNGTYDEYVKTLREFQPN